jgi:hypothetical protein
MSSQRRRARASASPSRDEARFGAVATGGSSSGRTSDSDGLPRVYPNDFRHAFCGVHTTKNITQYRTRESTSRPLIDPPVRNIPVSWTFVATLLVGWSSSAWGLRRGDRCWRLPAASSLTSSAARGRAPRPPPSLESSRNRNTVGVDCAGRGEYLVPHRCLGRDQMTWLPCRITPAY